MRPIRFVTGVLSALALVTSAEMLCGDFEPAKWEHFASINIDTPPVEEKGLVEVSLSPEVLDAARADLRDVRVVDEHGVEIAYVLHRTAPPAEQAGWLPAKLSNKTYLTGKSSSVTVDFGQAFLKDRIKINTKGSDFRRQVRIESSPDQKDWQRVREDALLFRINRDGKVEFERNVVMIPENNHRFMRVTVFNGDQDKGRVNIDLVGTHQLKRQPNLQTLTTEVPMVWVPVKDRKRETCIEFDLGYRNLPLAEITFDLKEPNFFRRAILEGRDRKTTVVKFRREDNSPAEKTVDVPWQTVRNFVLFRYSAGSRTSDEQLSLELDGTGTRYLRLRIQNGDDPGLTFLGAEAKRFLRLVRFPYRGEQPYRLFLGYPGARRPSYDLPHYINRLKSEGVTPATLASMSANPDFSAAARTESWLEQNRIVLWIALVGVGAVLAWLIARQARSVRELQERSQTPPEK